MPIATSDGVIWRTEHEAAVAIADNLEVGDSTIETVLFYEERPLQVVVTEEIDGTRRVTCRWANS